MANTKSAAKRSRQTAKRALRNRSVLTRLRRLHRNARPTGNIERSKLPELISAIDKAAKRGILHRNAARRRKARLTQLLNAAGKK
jgi:small subunit ribosomal protein S20